MQYTSNGFKISAVPLKEGLSLKAQRGLLRAPPPERHLLELLVESHWGKIKIDCLIENFSTGPVPEDGVGRVGWGWDGNKKWNVIVQNTF